MCMMLEYVAADKRQYALLLKVADIPNPVTRLGLESGGSCHLSVLMLSFSSKVLSEQEQSRSGPPERGGERQQLLP